MNIQVAIYDAATLGYKRSIEWNKESGQVECCGIAVDRDKGQVWMADWVQGEQLYCYDLQTGGYVRSLTLSPAPSLQQGIFCQDGCMLVSCDDGDADAGSFDNIYSVDLETGEVSLFRTMDDFILTGEIEGLTVNPLNGDLVVLSNRGIWSCFPTAVHVSYWACRRASTRDTTGRSTICTFTPRISNTCV